MAIINSDGLKIQPQNLADISPSVDDHFRLFSHDGTETITTVSGSQLTNSGFYLWDNTQGAWKPLKNTVTDTELLDGKGPSDYLLDVEEGGSLLAANVTAIDFTGHLDVIDEADGTVTIDPTHNHDSQYLDINNDSLTITAGSGLTGGGTVALGESVSLDVDFTRYTDTEAVTAVNSETNLNVDITGDAATVDGKNASDFVAKSGDSMAGTLDVAGNDLLDGTATLWDSVNQYIPQTNLQNDSLTVTAGSGLTGGGSVSLGSSVSLDVDASLFSDAGHTHSHSELTGVGSSDHHTRFAASEVDSTNWSDYEIQKNGSDASGVINFKT